ncbi:MAG: ABC transporter permease [Desulfurococcaceae archaeon]|nr:ABC transporter permease [Desulfurococcaceae archaeon]
MISDETIATILRSIYVSGTATLLASVWSLPTSYVLTLKRRVGVVEAVIESLVGIPTVLLGLLLYILLSSSGPLAPLGIKLLYTPQAIILGESILVTPLMISTSYRVLKNSVVMYSELALSLGASKTQVMTLVIRESLPGVVASIIMSFSRALGELGIAMMVGGNISGYTRVMTTAIALGVVRGEFEEAIVLGLVLMAIMVVISVTLKLINKVYGID